MGTCKIGVTFSPAASIPVERAAHENPIARRSLRPAELSQIAGVAVLSLALGIGANTAIFTLIDQLILRLLPVQEPDRIVLLAGQERHYGGNNGRNATSYLMYQDIQDATRSSAR